MKKGIKFRIYPNKEQKNLINQTLGCCRLIYNKGLVMREEAYQKGDKIGYSQTSSMLTDLKKQDEFAFLKCVDSIALQQSLRDLDRGFVNFFQKRTAHPTFKSKHNNHQSYRTINQADNIRIVGKCMKLPKLGFVRICQSMEIGHINNVTVERTPTGKYFAVLNVNFEPVPLSNHGGTVGIDVGIKEFYSDSNGNMVENPKYQGLEAISGATINVYEGTTGWDQGSWANEDLTVLPAPELTETPEPTEIPEPTATPEPTENPEPTETPEPTEAPEEIEIPENARVVGLLLDQERVQMEVGETAAVNAEVVLEYDDMAPEPTETPEPTEVPEPTEPEESGIIPAAKRKAGNTGDINFVVKRIQWVSEDTGVATVRNGVIRAVGEGETAVTVSCDGVTAAVEVEVIKAPEPTNVPEPTATPEPTEIPEPTNTPEPTVTPEPTETPEPTNTPEPTMTPEPTRSVTEIFTDVYHDWYTAYVQYVYDKGLMTGIRGTTRFDPSGNITKAQVAQVLHNMENQPTVEDPRVFDELRDVYQAEWYADAVAWAYEMKVVTGDLNSKKFSPNANVTREQLALMLYRYAKYKGYDTSQTSTLSGLKNAENVSNWAEDAVKWSVGTGLISGIDKGDFMDLAPQGNASRAQMAAILQRFFELEK